MLKKLFAGFVLSSVLLIGCGENNSVLSDQQSINTTKASQQEIAPFSTPVTKNGIDRFSKVSSALYRGSVPDENDMKYLKGIGIKTFINLRGAATIEPEADQIAQEKLSAAKLKENFVNIPVPFDKPIPDSMLKQFFKTVEDHKNQPVYVHCYHGRDRTGTMVALYRIRTEGISGKDALKDMQSFGFKPDDYPIFTKQVLSSTQAMLKKL